MADKEAHGVVIAYHPEGTEEPVAIHRPDGCMWGQQAMKSEKWQLFPNATVAEETGYWMCGRCFPE